MKTLIFTVVFQLLSFLLVAQNSIEVCENKTTHLVGKEKISYVQVGDHAKIVAEIIPDHTNVVRVKALESFEGESSITLVSAMRIYSLFVKYADINQLTHKLDDFHSEKAGDVNSGIMPEYILKEMCGQILNRRQQSIKRVKEKKDGITFQLKNVYLKNDLLFFELELTNSTNISFDVEGFHWWIDDKKELKASNVQEYQLEPVYQHNRIERIPENTTLREVFVLSKFTIPDKRILRIEVLETALGNTGRKLKLELKNKEILSAKSF